MTFNYMKNIYKNYKKDLKCINIFKVKSQNLFFLFDIKSYYEQDMKETKTWNNTINKILFTNYIRIPIIKNTKVSSVKGWNKLTKSANINKNNDVAYKTGKDAGFFVLDIDHPKNKNNEKDGYKKWLELKRKYNINTRTTQTKNKGLHLYFRYDADIKQTTKINGYSIDIRSDGGYIMSPESDGYTTVNHAEISTIPYELKKWIMAHYDNPKCKKTNSNVKKTNKIPKLNKNYIHLYNKDELKTVLEGLDKKYLNNRTDWLKVTSILKSENLYDLWDSWSIKSPVYDKVGNDKIWESLDPELDMMYINQISKTQLKINRTMKLNLFTKKPTETRNEKYINMDKFEHMNNRNILIKSGTGTGKTTTTVKMIKKITQTNKRKILSIVSRVSLAQQHHKNFNDNGIKLKSYATMDERHLNDCDNLVIQLDSITKIDWKKWQNCIIYVDEINSLVDYLLNSSTLRNKRMMVWQIFNMLIKNSGWLIGVDADISDNVLSLFDELNEEYYLIHNTYMNCKDKPAIHYNDKNRLISKMKMKLKNGEYFVACFDSLRDQNIIIEDLKQYCEHNGLDCKDDFLIYSSKDGDDNSLKDVSISWKNKYVFYSPKIVYGLDFNNEDELDVFFIGKGTSVNPLQFSQMVARTRNIKKLHYFIEEHNTPLEFDTIADVRIYFEDMTSYYDKVVNDCDKCDNAFEKPDLKVLKKRIEGMCYMQIDPRTGETVFSNVIYEKLFYQSYFYDQIMRSAMLYHFEQILKEKGYKITQNKKISKTKLNVKKLKDDVENNLIQKVDRIQNDKEESLTASELKLKQQMQKRADLLQIELDNEDFQDVIVDDKKFVNHLNISTLLKDNIDEQLVDKSYKDCGLNNVKSNVMKIKLIKQLEDKLGFQNSLKIDYDTDKTRFDENINLDVSFLKSIQKTFRTVKTPRNFKEVYNMLIGMYRNISKGVVKSKKLSNNDYKYTIDPDIITRTFKLINCRNAKLNGYTPNTYNFEIVKKVVKKLF